MLRNYKQLITCNVKCDGKTGGHSCHAKDPVLNFYGKLFKPENDTVGSVFYVDHSGYSGKNKFEGTKLETENSSHFCDPRELLKKEHLREPDLEK